MAKKQQKQNVSARQAASAQAQRLAGGKNKGDTTTRNIVIIVSVVVLALVVTAGFLIYQQANRTLFDDFEGAVPAGATNHGGLQLSNGAVGAAENAPEVQIYLDFMCPYCGQYEEINGADLQELADSGQATVTYHPMANLDGNSPDRFSTRSAAALAAVVDRAPEHAFSFVEAVFAAEPSSQGGLSDEQLQEVAIEVGIDESVATTITDGEFLEWVATATEQDRRDGVNSTPTTVINGDNWAPSDGEPFWSTPGVLRDAIVAAGPTQPSE